MAVTRYALRRHRRLLRSAEPERTGWPLPAALAVLAAATVATAFVSETLVGTLQAFEYKAHLSEFFVAFVIVAVVGHATSTGARYCWRDAAASSWPSRSRWPPALRSLAW